MEVTPARRAALQTMRALRSGELLDHAFARAAEALPPRERAFAQELVYGTVRMRGRIDFILSGFVQRKLDQLDDDALDILRLGAYQLIGMAGVPAYAAVSQAVELSKTSRAKHASGLINGVLQSLRRGLQHIQPPATDDPLHYLSTWESHPRWLVERWVAQFGEAGARALLAANNTRPDVFLRATAGARDEVIRALVAQGIEAEPVDLVPAGIRIAGSDVFAALSTTRAIVQDPAAMLVVDYAAFDNGRIVDLCAAPGGKALAQSSAQGLVIAGDISFDRLQRLRENAQRVGSDQVRFFAGDARQPPFRSFEQVLIDAPCTGTGTLRRHPDGKWRLKPADVATLAALQREILDAVAPRVVANGLLVYSTCSLEPEENELQVLDFLERHPDFKLEPSDQVDTRYMSRGMLHVAPHEHGWDGAFAARLRRRA